METKETKQDVVETETKYVSDTYDRVERELSKWEIIAKQLEELRVFLNGSI